MHNIATHIQSAVILMQWRIMTGTLGASMIATAISGAYLLGRSVARDLRAMMQPAE